MIDTEEEITFAEFKAWLAGLIRGKRGALPDLEDWKAIKKLMDKVVPDVAPPIVGGPAMPAPIIIREIVKEEPYRPEQFPYTPQPIWITPYDNTGYPPNDGVWCNGQVDIPASDGAGYFPQGGAGYFPQGQAVGGGMDCGATMLNAQSPTTTVMDGKEITSGCVTLDPAQMQFSFTTLDNSDAQLDDAIDMMFTAQENT